MIGPTGVGKTEISRRLAQARRRAVPQGRGDQVHRGRLCRPRRRADRARPASRSASALTRETQAQGCRGQARISRPRSACSTALVGAGEPGDARASARSCAPTSSTTRRSRSRCASLAAACRCSRSPACRARDGRSINRRHARQGVRRQTKTRRVDGRGHATRSWSTRNPTSCSIPTQLVPEAIARGREQRHRVPRRDRQDLRARGPRRRRRLARGRAARPAAADRGHHGRRPSTAR